MPKKHEKRDHSSGKSHKNRPRPENEIPFDAVNIIESMEQPKERTSSRKHRKASSEEKKRDGEKENKGDDTKGKHKSRKDKSEKEQINIEKYLEKSDKHKHRRKEHSPFTLNGCEIVVSGKKTTLRKEKTMFIEGLARTSEINLHNSKSDDLHTEKKHKKKKTEHSLTIDFCKEKASKHRKSRRPEKDDSFEPKKEKLGDNAQILYSLIDNIPFQHKEHKARKSKHTTPDSKERKRAESRKHTPDLEGLYSKQPEPLGIPRIKILHRRKKRPETQDKYCESPNPLLLDNDNAVIKKRRKKQKSSSKLHVNKSERTSHDKEHESRETQLREKVQDDIKGYLTKLQHMMDKELDAIFSSSKNPEDARLDDSQKIERKKSKRKHKRDRDERKLRKEARNLLKIETHKSPEISNNEINEFNFKNMHSNFGTEFPEEIKPQDRRNFLKSSRSSNAEFLNDESEGRMSRNIEYEKPERRNRSLSKVRENKNIHDIYRKINDEHTNIAFPTPKVKKFNAVYYDYKGVSKFCDNLQPDDNLRSSNEFVDLAAKFPLVANPKKLRRQPNRINLHKEHFVCSDFTPEAPKAVKKLDAVTVSVVKISENGIQVLDRSTDNLYVNLSEQEIDSPNELLERKKKTKRFRVYYNYALNDKDNCAETGTISDSFKKIESDDSDKDVENPRIVVQKLDRPVKSTSLLYKNYKISSSINLQFNEANTNKRECLKSENKHVHVQYLRPLSSSCSDLCLNETHCLNKIHKPERTLKDYFNDGQVVHKNNLFFDLELHSLAKHSTSVQAGIHKNEIYEDRPIELVAANKLLTSLLSSKENYFSNNRPEEVIHRPGTRNVAIGPQVDSYDLKNFSKTTDMGIGVDFFNKEVKRDYFITKFDRSKDVAIEAMISNEPQKIMCDMAIETDLYGNIMTQPMFKNQSLLKQKLTKDQEVQVKISDKRRKLNLAPKASLYEFNRSENTGTTFTSLKTSKSEVNMKNVVFQPKDCKITGLLATQKAIQISESSKSNSQSLEQFCLRSLISDTPQKSTLLLTKDYKPNDLSSYQKRKLYDETIRRKLRKKSKSHKKQLGPQVYEVRYLTIDPLYRSMKEKTHTKTECLSRIPVKSKKIVKKPPTMNLPVKRECIHWPVSDVDSLWKSRKIFNQEKMVQELYKNRCKFVSKSTLDSCSSLFTSYEESTATTNDWNVVTGEKLPELVEMVCKIALNCYQSNGSPINHNCDTAILDEVYTKNLSVKKQSLSCPIVNTQQEKGEIVVGCAVNNNVVNKNKPTESECSEESGYKSKSFCSIDFFEKPQIAALMRATVPTHPEFSGYYSNAESVGTNNEEVKTEITVDAELPDNISKEDDECSETPLIIINENDLQNLLDCNVTFSNTNLNASTITLVQPNEQNRRKSEVMISTHKVKSSIGNLVGPVKVENILAKRFFENLVEMYEKELAASKMLYKDDDFFQNDLLSCIGYSNKDRIKKRRFFGKIFRKHFVKWVGLKYCYYGAAEEDSQVERKSINCEHEEKLKLLAHNARKHFSMLVDATRINKEINDELKMCGLQKLLERIENGQFEFLTTDTDVDFHEELKSQVRESFKNVYAMAFREAKKRKRFLSFNDIKLIGAFVCKYRMGMLSKTDIIATHIGSGVLRTEKDLRAAVMYLIRRKTADIHLEEFRNYCKLLTEGNK